MQSFSGIVQKGLRRGTALGYPTVNIPFDAEGVAGVFAARVVIGGGEYAAAAFADPSRKLLEAHLLEFAGNLYGEEVTITLCKKLRDTRVFADDVALSAAIAQDVADARAHFNH